jgi:protein LTV1
VSSSYAVPTGRLTVQVRDDDPAPVAWDCETVLSTYSNVHNRPALVGAVAPARIRLGPSGVPRGVIGKRSRGDGPAAAAALPQDPVPAAVDEEDEDEDGSDASDDAGTSATVNAGAPRPRAETAAEKKERKRAVKEQRKVPAHPPWASGRHLD